MEWIDVYINSAVQWNLYRHLGTIPGVYFMKESWFQGLTCKYSIWHHNDYLEYGGVLIQRYKYNRQIPLYRKFILQITLPQMWFEIARRSRLWPRGRKSCRRVLSWTARWCLRQRCPSSRLFPSLHSCSTEDFPCLPNLPPLRNSGNFDHWNQQSSVSPWQQEGAHKTREQRRNAWWSH